MPMTSLRMKSTKYQQKSLRRKTAHHRLPPHSWEPHPTAKTGEVNRVVIIVLASLLALIVLLLLLFTTTRVFVGKAVEYKAPQVNTAGIFVAGGSATVGEKFVVPIRANIASPSVGVRFTLRYNQSLVVDCGDIFQNMDTIFSPEGGINLTILRKNEQCNGGLVKFEYAGLCTEPTQNNGCPNALQGDLTIAKLRFTAAAAGRYNLNFTILEILDLATSSYLVDHGQNASITVVAAPPPVVEQPAAASGGSGGSGGGVAWDCPPQWSACQNGKQQRLCKDRFRSGVNRTETRACVSAPAPPKLAEVQKPAVQQPAPPAPAQKPAAAPAAKQVQQPQPVKAPVVQKPAVAPSLFSKAKVAWIKYGQGTWQKYKVYVVAVPSALLVIITLLLLLHHFKKPKVVFNTEELKQWIKAEKAMGTADEHIQQILAQNTGWRKEEIDKAMQEAMGGSTGASPGVAAPPALPPGSS